MTEKEVLEYVDEGLIYDDTLTDHVNIMTWLVVRNNRLSRIIKNLLAENRCLKDKSTCKEDEDLFCYIMPGVTEDADRLKIHKEVSNLVRNYPLSTIWENLVRLGNDGKVYFRGVTCVLVYNELVRLGLPSANQGFSLGSFKNLYDKKAGKKHSHGHPMAS